MITKNEHHYETFAVNVVSHSPSALPGIVTHVAHGEQNEGATFEPALGITGTKTGSGQGAMSWQEPDWRHGATSEG